ncbi:MAG: class I SAM-dependent methyltransferase [Spirochaetes bacterium]|nr:class I SAM-dependent methyltransferase [Spirochaetota bacterium]
MICDIDLMLKEREINHLVDIATGDGWFAKELDLVFQSVNKITGIDIKNNGIDQFYQHIGNSKGNFICSDIHSYHWNDQDIDCIGISLSLHHLSDIESLLKKFYDILANNGLIFIREMITDNLTPAQKNQKTFHHLKAKMDQVVGTYHVNTYSLDNIHSMLEQTGFIKIYEQIDTNSQKCIKTQEVIESRLKVLKETAEKNYQGKIPPKISSEIRQLEKNIEQYGFSPPPIYLYIGLKL